MSSSNNSDNKRKIIIVTRDHDDYKRNYPLSKLIKEKEGNRLTSNLAAFEFAQSIYENKTQFSHWLREKGTEYYSNSLLNYIGNQDVKEWVEVPEKLAVLPIPRDGSKTFLYYDKIVNGNDEIYLLYWNRTKGLAKDLGVLLPLICKDCGIVENTASDNLLYIHDDEWGNRGNELLIFNKVNNYKARKMFLDEKEKILVVLLDKLITLNFSFAAAFQHNNSPGYCFHQILNMEFGEEPVFERLGRKEDENNCCEKLLESCDEVLKKPKL